MSGTSTEFLYDGVDVIAEYVSGSVVRRYIHGLGLDEPLVWYEGSSTSDRRYLFADERGSIVAVEGSSTTKNTYDEYGVPGSGNAGRYQYTGQMWLSDVGLYYYKARFYSPELGRFMQTDPIGYQDNMNLYAYVGNDPVNRSDPSGLSSVCDLRDVGRRSLFLGYENGNPHWEDQTIQQWTCFDTPDGPVATYSEIGSYFVPDIVFQNPAPPAIASRRACHEQAVGAERLRLQAEGWNVTLGGVRLTNPMTGDYAVADIAMSRGSYFDLFNGFQFGFIEVKTGNADYTDPQHTIYAMMLKGTRVITAGPMAGTVGIPVNTLLTMIPVYAGSRYGDGKSSPCTKYLGTIPPP